MTTFLQSLLSGLAQGSIYALLALGYVMIYKATHVISFAQPALMVCGGLFAYHATSEWGLGFWPALIVAIVLGALLGMLVERLALRPMVGKPVFTLAIITIGVDIVLRIFANRYMGPDPRSVPYPGGSERYEFWGLSISHQRLGLMAVTAVTVIALALFFRYAKTGLAMRATALSQETALAQGIRVGCDLRAGLGHRGRAGGHRRHLRRRDGRRAGAEHLDHRPQGAAGDHHRRPRQHPGRRHRRPRRRAWSSRSPRCTSPTSPRGWATTSRSSRPTP